MNKKAFLVILSVLLLSTVLRSETEKVVHSKSKHHKSKMRKEHKPKAPNSKEHKPKEIKKVTPPVVVKQHPSTLHVYVDPKNMIYWPIDLPFWVRLSPSAEPGAASFLLNHVSLEKEEKGHSSEKEREKDAKEAARIEKEGIKLELPGNQFIRWINVVSKNEIRYKFHSDGVPPHVEINYLHANRYERNSVTYFGPHLTTKVNATDDQSGVESSFISFDKSKFHTFKEEIPLDEEKIYQIFAYAIDNVGYISPTISSKVQVDLTPPMTTSRVRQNFVETALSKDTVIYLDSKDALSGVKTTHYKFDGASSYRVYDPQKGVSVDQLADGSHILSFYSLDQVENRESPQKYLFYLVKTPPTVAYSLVGEHFSKDHKVYISPRTRIRIDATASHVQVKKILYQIGSEDIRTYVTPFSAPPKSGEVEISYFAVDELQNAGPKKSVFLIMDHEAPKSTFEIVGPVYKKDKEVIYLTSESQIKIHSEDTLSGVKQIEFQLNEEPSQIYSEPIRISAEGRYLFHYGATDRVNNQETEPPVLMVVNNKPPILVDVFSMDPVKVINDKDGNRVEVYPVGVTLQLNATDDASGFAMVNYSINGEKSKVYEGPLSFKKQGDYVIEISATNKLGLKMTKKKRIKISGTP